MGTTEAALRDLMVAGLGGDAGAHAALLRALVPLLRGFYRRRVRGGDDDIEDLVQETLIAVHTRRATWDPNRPFTAWLFAIARYKMIDRIRRHARLAPIEDADAIATADDFEAEAIARLDVDTLLEHVSPKQARMIRATRLDGLSVAEAAAAEGIGQSDVKISVHRGLKALVARVHGGTR